MEIEHVSSPSIKPRYHLYFTINTPSETRFLTHAFRTAYAANYWLTSILTACTDSTTQSWKDNKTLILTHEDTTLTIKGEQLEDLIEYTPTQKESQWTPNHPDSSQVDRLCRFWQHKPAPTYTPKPTPAPKPKSQNRHKSQKEAPEGSITVAILAAQHNLPANKARQILRKNNIKKPAGGWTFKADDPIVETITNLFKA